MQKGMMQMKRLNKMTLRGSTLTLKDYSKVHKIILTYSAPKLFYKVLLPYLLLATSVGILIGSNLHLLDYLY